MHSYLFYFGDWVLRVTLEWHLVWCWQPDVQHPSLKGSLLPHIWLCWISLLDTWGNLKERTTAFKKLPPRGIALHQTEAFEQRHKNEGTIMRNLWTARCMLHGFIIYLFFSPLCQIPAPRLHSVEVTTCDVLSSYINRITNIRKHTWQHKEELGSCVSSLQFQHWFSRVEKEKAGQTRTSGS